MTADERKIISDYLELKFNAKEQRWNLIMPAVRKVGEELLVYWKVEQDTEAYALQTNMEFYVVNVQFAKAVKHLIEAIQWIMNKRSNTGNSLQSQTQN